MNNYLNKYIILSDSEAQIEIFIKVTKQFERLYGMLLEGPTITLTMDGINIKEDGSYAFSESEYKDIQILDEEEAKEYIKKKFDKLGNLFYKS